VTSFLLDADWYLDRLATGPCSKLLKNIAHALKVKVEAKDGINEFPP